MYPSPYEIYYCSSTCAYIFEPIDSVSELIMSPLALATTDDSDSVNEQDDGRAM